MFRTARRRKVVLHIGNICDHLKREELPAGVYSVDMRETGSRTQAYERNAEKERRSAQKGKSSIVVGQPEFLEQDAGAAPNEVWRYVSLSAQIAGSPRCKAYTLTALSRGHHTPGQSIESAERSPDRSRGHVVRRLGLLSIEFAIPTANPPRWASDLTRVLPSGQQRLVRVTFR